MKRSRACRSLVGSLVAFVVTGGMLAAPALAGGSWFDPVRDRYEPGETATMVGYTGGGAYGWVEDGPFSAYIALADPEFGELPSSERIEVGPIDLLETDAQGWLRLRASITFELPDDLLPGMYFMGYCNVDCTRQLGDLIGGNLYIGVDPPAPLTRQWPASEPELVNLDPESIVTGPGYSMTARELIDSNQFRPPPLRQDDPGEPTSPTLDFGAGDPAVAPPDTEGVEPESPVSDPPVSEPEGDPLPTAAGDPSASSIAPPSTSNDAVDSFIDGEVESTEIGTGVLVLSAVAAVVGVTALVLLLRARAREDEPDSS
ncbi:MAG: hypothetical protein HKN26_07345 [Acidimicrobiales bacterium]|nr:hypothetical protein [Acidimicrobiales bacterium]